MRSSPSASSPAPARQERSRLNQSLGNQLLTERGHCRDVDARHKIRFSFRGHDNVYPSNCRRRSLLMGGNREQAASGAVRP